MDLGIMDVVGENCLATLVNKGFNFLVLLTDITLARGIDKTDIDDVAFFNNDAFTAKRMV